MNRNNNNKDKPKKRRDSNWKWRQALGHKVVPSKKPYPSRKESNQIIKKILVSCVVLLLTTSNAYSQNVCAERLELIKRLWDKWQEEPLAKAIVNDNNVIEVFVSKSRSWTIIISDRSGRSCVVSTGRDWTDVDPNSLRNKGP